MFLFSHFHHYVSSVRLAVYTHSLVVALEDAVSDQIESALEHKHRREDAHHVGGGALAHEVVDEAHFEGNFLVVQRSWK